MAITSPSLINDQVLMVQTLIEHFGCKWKAFCNYRIEPYWTIHKEAVCVKTDFQKLSGGACHPNNRFDQSDSSSVTHALVPNLFTGDC